MRLFYDCWIDVCAFWDCFFSEIVLSGNQDLCLSSE